MAMAAAEIEKLILASFPTAKVTITDLAGDGNHYAAEVIAEEFDPQRFERSRVGSIFDPRQRIGLELVEVGHLIRLEL